MPRIGDVVQVVRLGDVDIGFGNDRPQVLVEDRDVVVPQTVVESVNESFTTGGLHEVPGNEADSHQHGVHPADVNGLHLDTIDLDCFAVEDV